MQQNMLIWLRKTVYIFSTFYIFYFKLLYYVNNCNIRVTNFKGMLYDLICLLFFMIFTSTLREIPIIKKQKKTMIELINNITFQIS